MFFSVITKNLTWAILNKNLVTLKMKNFDIMGVAEKSDFWEICLWKINIWEELAKNGVLESLQIYGGLGKKENCWGFFGEGLIP